MATTADLSRSFESMALRMKCDESDFLLLLSLGIDSFNELFFRSPTAKDMEELMEELVGDINIDFVSKEGRQVLLLIGLLEWFIF